jgi:signal transduction histidine kinase
LQGKQDISINFSKPREVFKSLMRLFIYLPVFSFLLITAVARGQHPVLEECKARVGAIKVNAADYVNDSAYLSEYARLLFYLSHFRDTTISRHLTYFDSITRKSRLPVARAYWLNGESYYLHTVQKNYKQSLNNNLEAISIFEKEKYYADAAKCHARVSGTLMWQSTQESNNQQTLADGVLHGKIATRLGKQVRDTTIICTGLMYAANNFLVMGKPDSAKTLLLEAANYADRSDLKYPADNNVWGTLSELYSQLGNIDMALLYAGKCLETGIRQNDYYSISAVYQIKGELHSLQGNRKNYQEAIKYLDSALVYAGKLKDIAVMAKVEQSLFNMHKAAGNEQGALYYLEQATLHADALRRQNETSIKADYELAQREKQITQLERDKLMTHSKKQRLLIWLLSLGGLLIALATLFFARNNYLLRQKKKEIEAALKKGQNIERKRMAADLHDNLGVQASAILHSASVLKEAPLENTEMVENLHDTAKEMIVNLRETLWAMNNTEVPAVEAWIRAINFVKQMRNHYKQLHFSISGDAPENFVMESPKALHILMMVQEAVNNAAKHADASLITVNSKTDSAVWHITVHDNGKGYLPHVAKEKMDSYGLKNMMERAKASSTTVDIESTVGAGTTVNIAIPLS